MKQKKRERDSTVEEFLVTLSLQGQESSVLFSKWDQRKPVLIFFIGKWFTLSTSTDSCLPSNTPTVLQNSVVFKICWVSGTPTENYRPGWVSMAGIGVYEQELTYLPSSCNNKSESIFIRQLPMLLWKLRPGHWLLPFRGRHDSVDLFYMSPLISFIQLNCPPSVLPPERQAVNLQSWDGQGKSYSLPFSNYPGNHTWLTHSSTQ